MKSLFSSEVFPYRIAALHSLAELLKSASNRSSSQSAVGKIVPPVDYEICDWLAIIDI